MDGRNSGPSLPMSMDAHGWVDAKIRAKLCEFQAYFTTAPSLLAPFLAPCSPPGQESEKPSLLAVFSSSVARNCTPNYRRSTGIYLA